ncbi:HAD domain-containing protein [Cupriavidus basilensis]
MTRQQSVITNPNPLALNLRTLGLLVREQRVSIGLSQVEAAANMRLPTDALAHLEEGKPISTEVLFTVLADFGLAMLVMPKASAIVALDAVGHAASWSRMPGNALPARSSGTGLKPICDCPTPTLFLDFDGTLHAGHALIDEAGRITLDSGRPLFEFAPLLAELLRPYPAVEIVLTTSWLQELPMERVIAYLPPELAQRVVGTTKDIKPRFGDLRSGTARTYVIVNYAYSKRLKNWLAIDDSVYGAYNYGDNDEEVEHFLLLDSNKGISDAGAQQQIRAWLEQP